MKNTHKPALTVSNLGIRLFKRSGFLGRKTFSHWALEDVSFDVRRGEVFGVIGRNGAGKSSLLRLLANIFEPDRGTIRSYGLKVCLLSLQTGFVHELTGRENIILSGMLFGKSRQEILEQLPEIEEFAELGKWIDQPISTYSSGMAARLGFSVSMYTNTDIILIDEALAVGDQSFRLKSQEKIKEVLQSDKTVVLVSHNAGAVEDLTERAVWIEKGRSVLNGDSKVVAAAYNRFNEYLRDQAGKDSPENLQEKALAYALDSTSGKKRIA